MLLQASFFISPAFRPAERTAIRFSPDHRFAGGPSLAIRIDTIRPR